MTVAVVVVDGARPAGAQPPAPRAWILVDLDTGKVITGSAYRKPMPPASLSKVFTALAAVRALPLSTGVPVSVRAAAAPAHVIGMKTGQVWTLDSALHPLLMSSANDAAVAVAERVSGSLDRFQGALAQLAGRLALADHPVLRDPAGLDDGASVGGGNLVSARDLAIAGRAVLADGRLAPIVGQREFSFAGPDGRRHRLVNHNKLLRRYPGTVGVKTGYTARANGCLIAAARRHGRTMLTVVLGVQDIYSPTMQLLDRGFATPVSAEPSVDRLPAVGGGAARRSRARTRGRRGGAGRHPSGGRGAVRVTPFAASIAEDGVLAAAGASIGSLVGLMGLVRRRAGRRRARRRHPSWRQPSRRQASRPGRLAGRRAT